MSLADITNKFIVSEDAFKQRLERIVGKALKHCVIDRSGQVLIQNQQLSGRDQVKLVLAARSLASQLDDKISATVTVAEISKYTGLPTNQVRARGKEAINDKFADSPTVGLYQAIPNKIEAFLERISSFEEPAEHTRKPRSGS